MLKQMNRQEAYDFLESVKGAKYSTFCENYIVSCTEIARLLYGICLHMHKGVFTGSKLEDEEMFFISYDKKMFIEQSFDKDKSRWFINAFYFDIEGE